MFYIAGPGHGGPAIVGNVYLEGTWSEVYPNVTQDEAGLKELFKQFSFPGGISSHVAPTTPGSIHEGGELGYSLSHAFGAAFDNPGLIVACVIGDGEAETGPLATAWQSNKFLDPVTDGAVLPILHLNGYKISNPTILARIEAEELEQFLRGCGWAPLFVEGDDPNTMHELMASAMESAIEDIRRMQNTARTGENPMRPRWPMIVLRSPKGWTGPKIVDGLPIEGTFRAHQVPMLVDHCPSRCLAKPDSGVFGPNESGESPQRAAAADRRFTQPCGAGGRCEETSSSNRVCFQLACLLFLLVFDADDELARGGIPRSISRGGRTRSIRGRRNHCAYNIIDAE